MTTDEYHTELRAYISEQVRTVPDGPHSLTFWAEFNNKCKADYDANLAAQGIVVE